MKSSNSGMKVVVRTSSGGAMFDSNNYVRIDIVDENGGEWRSVIFYSEGYFLPRELVRNWYIRKAKRIVRKRIKLGVVPDNQK